MVKVIVQIVLTHLLRSVIIALTKTFSSVREKAKMFVLQTILGAMVMCIAVIQKMNSPAHHHALLTNLIVTIGASAFH